MKFEKALKNRQAAKSAKIQADKRLVLAETKVKKSRNKIEEAHEGLTDLLAMAEVESVSEDEIEKARQDYDAAKSGFEEAKTALEVSKKVIPLVNQKLAKAKEAFREPAYSHYKKQSSPLIDNLLKVLNDFEAVYGKMDELKTEIDSHGMSGDNFLPSQIESFKMNHLKHGFNLGQYRKEINSLKQ